MFGNLIGEFLASYAAFTSYAIASLGDAIIFQICFYVLDLLGIIESQTLSDVISKYSFVALFNANIQAFYLRKDINFKLGTLIGILNSLAVVIGVEVLVANENIWLRRALGWTILFFFILNMIVSTVVDRYRKNQSFATKQLQKVTAMTEINSVGNISNVNNVDNHTTIATAAAAAMHDTNEINEKNEKNEKDEETGNTAINGMKAIEETKMINGKPGINGVKSWIFLVSTALVSGFMYGIFGIAGPPWMIWLLITNFEKNTFRATIAYSFGLFINPTISIYLLYFKNKFDKDGIEQYITVFVGCILGLTIGNLFLAKHIDQQLYQKFIKIILCVGSSIISVAGIDLATVIVSCISAVLIMIFIIYVVSSLRKKRSSALHADIETVKKIDNIL